MGRVVGHELAEAVDLAIGHREHPADVAQYCARLQFAEGDDLRNPVITVFALDVADHLVAPVLTKIDVEIGHRHALGVQEALEQQAKAQGIEIGDRQSPGDDRAGAGTAPRTDRDSLALCPLDEVGDDQEIAGKAHRDDCAQFELEPLMIGLCLRPADPETGEAYLEPGQRPAPQCHLLGVALLCRKGRQDRLARLRDKGAALGYYQSIIAGLRQISEQCPHLCRRPKVMQRGQPPAIVVGDDCALSDAHQRVMRLIKILIWEMDVVGRDKRQIVAISELDKSRLAARLVRSVVTHQFDIEPALERPSSTRRAASRQRLLALPPTACRGGP